MHTHAGFVSGDAASCFGGDGAGNAARALLAKTSRAAAEEVAASFSDVSIPSLMIWQSAATTRGFRAIIRPERLPVSVGATPAFTPSNLPG